MVLFLHCLILFIPTLPAFHSDVGINIMIAVMNNVGDQSIKNALIFFFHRIPLFPSKQKLMRAKREHK